MSKPNIIYFLSDQHNAAMAGYAGNKDILTPNLDKLAASGAVFDNCYCNSPLCVPSRTSILSGRMPTKTRIVNNMQIYPTEQLTVAHSLTIAGYETVLCGRMHFSGYDQWHGFEKRIATDITNSFPGKHNEDLRYNMLRGTSGQSRVSVELSGRGSSCVLKYDEDVIKTATEFLDNREDERPLFMVIGTYGPHCPYVAYEKWYDYYYNKLDDYKTIMEDYKVSPHAAMEKWRVLREVQDVTLDEIRRVRAAYAALITIMDEHLGTVMESLGENLDMENTVVIYTSDHGDNAGEHGLFWKTNFFEGSSRVPTVFSCPSKFKSGTRFNNVNSLLDITPTIIDLAGGEHLPEEDGSSLVDNLVSGDELAEKAIISVLADIKGDNPSAMVRFGNYKLIIHAGYESVQLFDLANDPFENNDLGEDTTYSDIIADLKAKILAVWNPEYELHDLKVKKAEFKMLKNWVNIAGWEAQYEFMPDEDYNFLNN